MKVLIVDDDESTLDVLEEFVEGEGFKVLTASDGSIAVNVIEENELDVVLTDLKMPGADGIEVLKAAKKANPDMHVVILTGYASLDTTLQAIKEGAYDYIAKPFKLEEVALVLKNVSEKVTLEREKGDLIEDLRNTYKELDILREAKTELDQRIGKINKRMEEDHYKITESLEMIQTIPGNLLPFHYLQTKERDCNEVIDSLERLGKLKKEGIITEEELRAYKERLWTNI